MYLVIIVSIVILATTAIIWLEALRQGKMPIDVFEWTMTIMSIVILISVLVKGI